MTATSGVTIKKEVKYMLFGMGKWVNKCLGHRDFSKTVHKCTYNYT